MNTPSNGASDSPVTAGRVAPADISETRRFYWSVRRELWENRYLYIAPLVVACFVLLGTLIRTFSLAYRMPAGPKAHAALVGPLNLAPAPIMFATLLIGFFYCLDALYGERRDRSILFWKSLPVSDRTTVLSKVAVPLVVLPLFAFALSIATQRLLLLVATAALFGKGLSAAPLWSEFRLVQGAFGMIYGLGVHALWYAPIYGWFLMISAWARRTPILWAVLPLLLVSAVERIAFQTVSFMRMLQYRLTGAMREGFSFDMSGGRHQITGLEPARFFSAPGLWIGLAFAALFVWAAIRLRRYREPI